MKKKQLIHLVNNIANELNGIAVSDMETAEINIVRHLYDAGFGKLFRKIVIKHIIMNKTTKCFECKKVKQNCFQGADGKYRCQTCLDVAWKNLCSIARKAWMRKIG